MIKSLQLHILLKKSVAISLRSGIYTDSALLRRIRNNYIPPNNPDEPGIRKRRDILKKTSDHPVEIADEEDIEGDVDLTKIDEFYSESERNERRFKERVKLKIAAKKFFSPCPEPQMLTYNERLCIRNLHQQDPVQWNFQTLSESFPATPDTIKKVLRWKRKFTPESAKKLDLKVQKNWELLAEGKLDAEPHVLNHLKTFINRREVLLEQIKNETFYLPEIKKEYVWNQGEMNNIYGQYEKAVENLCRKNDTTALTDGGCDVKDEEKKNELALIQKNTKRLYENIPEAKDSIRFGKMFSIYSEPSTLEGFEKYILQKADKGKALDSSEKAVLENKLGVNKNTYSDFAESSPPSTLHEERTSLKQKNKLDTFDNMTIYRGRKKRFLKSDFKETSSFLNYAPPDKNTLFGSEKDMEKIFSDLKNNNSETPGKTEDKINQINKKKKREIYFSNPAILEQEKVTYDAEVSHIKNTAFWNNSRTSKEKEQAELDKRDHEGPVTEKALGKPQKIFVLSTNNYPERIKIPEGKRGSGLTFKVKDCYYDDDGEFLYRVPGMTK